MVRADDAWRAPCMLVRRCAREDVVLSASLLSRNGKVLVARQFVEITRIRLEGLLTAFPKLLSSGTREHTFIDTESVRYVYQPLESFFVLIITNKTSNIVEDLHTIQLLAKLVPDICGSLTEASIRDKQFELVFGFDELLTAGGHSENINLQQIRVNMEMESHEEKLHNMILESKRAAAKDDMKRNMTRIKEEQRERARMERAGMGMGSASSFGSQMASSFGSASNSFGRSPRSGGDSYASPSSGGMTSPTSSSSFSRSDSELARPAVSKAAGMKLGGGAKTGKSFLDAMAAEDGLKELPPMSAQVVDVPKPEIAAAVSHDPVGTVVEEKITVSLNRDGSIEQLEIKGNLYVNVNDPASGCCRLKLRSSNANGISFQTHPKVDKKLFDQDSILGLKDGSKPFPSTRVAVLRWSVKSQDETLLPLNITCWPDREGNDKLNVTIEYEMQREMALDNVNIIIPLGSHDAPHIASIDGVYQHNPAEGKLLWHQDRIDSSNGSGAMEFSIRGQDLDAFFPIQVSFFSRSVYSDVDIESVYRIDDNSPVRFGFEKLLSTESYQIV